VNPSDKTTLYWSIAAALVIAIVPYLIWLGYQR